MRSVLTEGDLEKVKADNNISKDAVPQSTTTDDRISAIAKFIPGEAVAIFLGAFGLFSGAMETTPVEWLGFGMFIFCLIVAIVISYYKASREKISFVGISGSYTIPKKWIKVAITTFAFVIWAFNIEGFVAIVRDAIPAYDPLFGALFLLIYTTLVPLIYTETTKP